MHTFFCIQYRNILFFCHFSFQWWALLKNSKGTFTSYENRAYLAGACKNVSVLNAKKSMHFIVRFEVKGVVLFVIGIHGNTVVDKEANDALEAPIYNCSIPFTLHGVCTTWLKLFLHEANKNCDEFLNVFRQICYEFAGPRSYSLVGKIPCSYGQNRKGQVILTRCLLGHDIFILCSFSSCSIVVFIWVQQYQQFNTILYFISYFVNQL
jgi:hypothetical protein